MNTSEAAQAAGASLRMLQHWSEIELLRPTNRGIGKDYRRDWSPQEVALAKLVIRLRAKKVSMRDCRIICKHMRENVILSGWWVVGDSLIHCLDAHQVAQAATSHKCAVKVVAI